MCYHLVVSLYSWTIVSSWRAMYTNTMAAECGSCWWKLRLAVVNGGPRTFKVCTQTLQKFAVNMTRKKEWLATQKFGEGMLVINARRTKLGGVG